MGLRRTPVPRADMTRAAMTATAVAIAAAAPPPSAAAVRRLCVALDAAADSVAGGGAIDPAVIELASDDPLQPVAEAVHVVLTVLARARAPDLAGR